MRQIKVYQTKAKWCIHVDEDGLPRLGYSNKVFQSLHKALGTGENVLLHGALILEGTSRGRSAAHFNLYAANEWSAHLTVSGAEQLFQSVADGRTSAQIDTWSIVRRGFGGSIYQNDEITAPVFRGYWTVTKQGTEFSLIPAPPNIIP